MLRVLVGVFAVGLLLLVLRDAFETIVLPRRVQREFRLTRLFYRTTWPAWRRAAHLLPGRFREHALGWFGPFSLLMLLAVWAMTMVFAFALLQWAGGSVLGTGKEFGILDDLYFSGTTFVTLGLGDLAPQGAFAKLLTVAEAGLGFAFLALTIGYLPVIYQAFSRREIPISLLDARAGSPPSAGELLRRHGGDGDTGRLTVLLTEWERWAAEVLESHLSYPVLAYFRSQHWNQSWVSTLTLMLDTSATIIEGTEGPCREQARLTFAMARHAAVDLAQVFSVRQPEWVEERLPDTAFARLVTDVEGAGINLTRTGARARLAEWRVLYEPYVTALSRYLGLPLPAWTNQSGRRDNWEQAPWEVSGVRSGD